jgi:signal transduction histidine kinase
LTARLIKAQEEERRRIARELHDDLNQRLALLVAHLEDLARTGGGSSTPLNTQILSMSSEANEISHGISELSHKLHSSALDLLGLVPALRRLTRDLAQTYDISITFTSSDGFAIVPSDVALCLFRVTQEALMNVVKHSEAKSANVQLSRKDGNGMIELTITDDGKGFDPSGLRTDSLGLISMRERVKMVGGELEILSMNLKGTRIRAQVPS